MFLFVVNFLSIIALVLTARNHLHISLLLYFYGKDRS